MASFRANAREVKVPEGRHDTFTLVSQIPLLQFRLLIRHIEL